MRSVCSPTAIRCSETPRCCGSTPSGERISAGIWRRDGQERLRSVDAFATTAAASIAAENALAFAARPASVRRRRHRRRSAAAAPDGWTDGRRSGRCGELADVPLRRRGHGGAAEIAAVFAQLRLESSLAPFERRVAYLHGHSQPAAPSAADADHRALRDRRRSTRRRPVRQALASVRAPRQYRAGAAEQPGAFRRRYRCARDRRWRSNRFARCLRNGLDEWSYVISTPPGNTFTYRAAGSLWNGRLRRSRGGSAIEADAAERALRGDCRSCCIATTARKACF